MKNKNQLTADRLDAMELPRWVRNIVDMTGIDIFDEMFGSCETPEDVVEVCKIGAEWYAVQEDPEDPWDYGTYDWEEAIEMLKAQGHGLIAVIINDDYCLAELKIVKEEIIAII